MALPSSNDSNDLRDTDVSGPTSVGAPADSENTDPFVVDVSSRYRVLKPLGGIAGDALYLARHLRTGALVELRRFAGDPGADEDLVGALRHLAARAARVSDQCAGITTISECERTANTGLALAMEHRSGTTLRETIRREGRLNPERAIPIAIKIAEILQRAHNCSLVHGGLRPDNVLLIGAEPPVLLTQYGVDRILARWTASRRRKGAVVRNHTVYQAPEQAHGETTERSDIYACGAILYEMLAGSFPRTGIASLRRGHLEPLAKRYPDITPSLERIVTRTLLLKPERRPDISALCNDLRAEIGAKGQPKPSRPSPTAGLWPRVRKASLVGGGLVIAIGLAIWVGQAHIVSEPKRWELLWSLFGPANTRVSDDPSPTLTAPNLAVPAGSEPAPASPPSPASPSPVVSPSPIVSPSSAPSPPVKASAAPPADPAATATMSPERSSEPNGDAKTPPKPLSAPNAMTRPKPTAPLVDARSEPVPARSQDVTPAPRPRAPNAPEPARATRETDDPGAVIDWLLKEGGRPRQ
jgi:serine/threonine protein kinase